jgi:RimJ/RimL family protein N-acetyltransferase
VKRVGTEKRGLVTDDELRRLADGEQVRGERIRFPEAGLVDGDVRVRLPREADAPHFYRGLTDRRILYDAGIRDQPELSEELLAQRLTREDPVSRREGHFLRLVIAEAASDEFAGAVLLHSFDWRLRQCEIGYWLLPESRGRGMSARAASLVARFAIEQLGLDRVEAKVDSDNEASLRSIETAGFTREGTLRSLAHAQRGATDAILYSLIRSDLKPRRRTARRG